MCRLCRRGFLTGAAALGAHTALPAWAQFPGAIKPQSDPYAQVDPYADPRNGFPSDSKPAAQKSNTPFRAMNNGALSQAEKDEVAIGRQGYAYWIQKSGGAVNDAGLQQALKDFCAPFFAAADRSNLPWVVTLVSNDVVNASAGAGGTVIVHTGIIKICDKPEEFASILAHEIGHVDNYHSMRGIDLNALLEKLSKDGFDPLGTHSVGELLPETQGAVEDYLTLVSTSYSRADESQADLHAIEIFERMGIDTRLAASGFKQLQHYKELRGTAGGNEWAQTHPLTSNRIANVSEAAALRSRGQADHVYPGWDALKAAYPTYAKLRHG